MAINLSDNININSPKILDSRYGPWSSVSAANTGILSLQRSVGLTVGISGATGLLEYWYANGISDSNLVLKTTSNFTGGTVTGATIYTGGLSANTISATTYYNLPISGLTEGPNISITGANGNYTVSFTGTTGSNFTGGTVTGATIYTGGLTANTLNVSGVTILDGTTASTISATTISAVNYLNLPYPNYITTGSSGTYSLKTANGSANDATANYAISFGFNTIASGVNSHAEGSGTTASGSTSHAEGFSTISIGTGSHAEGYKTYAKGDYSHVEGFNTIAFGTGSHAEGYNNRDLFTYTFAETPLWYGASANQIIIFSSSTTDYFGNQIIDRANYTNVFPAGSQSFVFNSNGNYALFTITASTYSRISAGQSGTTISFSGSNLSATTVSPTEFLGYVYKIVSTVSGGSFSHSEGYQTIAMGDYSHSEGQSTLAKGINSHAEGTGTNATGEASHAEGNYTTAVGQYSHAEGNGTTAIGNQSHAEGEGSIAAGLYSHAEGVAVIASGSSSHSEGFSSFSIGDYSHAEGYRTNTSFRYIWPEITTLQSGNRLVISGYNYTSLFQANSTAYLLCYLQNISVDFYLPFTITASTYTSNNTIISFRSSEVASITGVTSIVSFSNGGDYSHAEGLDTASYGDYSHAEGRLTIAGGIGSYAGGYRTVASGDYSYVHGSGSTASGFGTMVFGNNIIGTENNTSYFERGRFIGAGTSSPILQVSGSVGTLLQVKDELTADIFNVVDSNSHAILQVFSGDVVTMGNYVYQSYNTTTGMTITTSGLMNIVSVPTYYNNNGISYDSVFVDYSVKYSGGARAGNIMIIQSGTTVQFSETSTNDIGDTSVFIFSANTANNYINLYLSSTTNTGTIKTIVRAI
jgi:hypothetical protein